MTRTRAQEKAGAGGEIITTASTENNAKKRKSHAADSNALADKPDGKKLKHDKRTHLNLASSTEKIEKLLSLYGSYPFEETALSNPKAPEPSTLLAHLFNALLSSTRISHTLAAKTVRTVIEAGYADLGALEKSTWDDRTEVLTKGGYTRYREKTATQLGQLADWLRTKYDGDLNNLLQQAKDEGGNSSDRVREGVRQRLKEVKGIGNVALDIYCDTAQAIVAELAPFIDPRSLKTAEALGMSTDVNELYEAVNKDHVKMCRLASALTHVRLEKKESEFA